MPFTRTPLARRALAVLLTTAVVAACADEPSTPRPLSQPEAERLAMSRFHNHEAGVVAFSSVLPFRSAPIHLDGRIDFVSHLGHAAMWTEDRVDPDSAGALRWTPSALAFRPDRGSAPAQDGWTTRPIDQRHSELDALLMLLLSLAIDRPENAGLLRQGGASLLHATTLRGVPVDVVEGPRPAGPDVAPADHTPGSGRLRYWIDADGTMLRVEARLGNLTDFAVIDLRHGDPLPTPSGQESAESTP